MINFYRILCGFQVSICLLIDDILDSSLNQLYHIYNMSYSHRIIGTITNKCTVHYRKILRFVYVVKPDRLFLNNIWNLQRCLKTNYLWMYGYLLYSNSYWTHTINTRNRSKRWSIDFHWLTTKFVFSIEFYSLCVFFKLSNPFFILKNLNLTLKNPYFITNFANTKIMV